MKRFRRYLRWSKSLSLPARYLLATLLVALAAAMRWALDPILAHYPFMMFFLAVTLSALLLDMGTGFYSSLLSAVTGVYLFVDQRFAFLITNAEDVVGLFVFLVVSFVITAAGEILRALADMLDSEEERNGVLLRELDHRTRDNLQIIGSTIAIHSVNAPTAEARQYLATVAERIGAIGRVQQRVFPPGAGEWIGGVEFLDGICGDIALTLVGRRPIMIGHEAQPMSLRRGMAASLGIILNELTGNAVAHAFPDGRTGVVDVRLELDGAETLLVTVSDNGIGCGPAIGGTGSGIALVNALAGQMGGRASWEDASPGCRVRVRLPLAGR